MAVANYPSRDEVVYTDERTGKGLTASKALAKTFGYMGIGLAITAVVTFAVALFFVYVLKFPNLNVIQSTAQLTAEQNRALVTYVVTMIVSLIVLLIDHFVFYAVCTRGKHSAWVPYIIYTVAMGTLMSGFLLMGIDFQTMGLAFGIAAIVFLALFLIGYFSKANLNILGFIAMGAFFMIVMMGFMFGILFLITGTFNVFNLIVTIAFTAIILISTAVDAYNIRRILAKAEGNNNVILFCAFTMYADFILILLRVLALIVRLKGK